MVVLPIITALVPFYEYEVRHRCSLASIKDCGKLWSVRGRLVQVSGPEVFISSAIYSCSDPSCDWSKGEMTVYSHATLKEESKGEHGCFGCKETLQCGLRNTAERVVGRIGVGQGSGSLVTAVFRREEAALLWG